MSVQWGDERGLLPWGPVTSEEVGFPTKWIFFWWRAYRHVLDVALTEGHLRVLQMPWNVIMLCWAKQDIPDVLNSTPWFVQNKITGGSSFYLYIISVTLKIEKKNVSWSLNWTRSTAMSYFLHFAYFGIDFRSHMCPNSDGIFTVGIFHHSNCGGPQAAGYCDTWKMCQIFRV